ncbi:phosphoribosylformylglycinamidine synthase, partial [Anaerostipes hadrus]|nr:phosphoribosylformylglycinamidine synthase [Anaerostipes hadrus]
EEWLISFKNETHNHPTEIEPFGGAATCLGGAIRDPLSGRSYVYQAMRVTGAADPTVPLKDTLKGKLPQYKIVNEAANGYSSYGNQIGLATGYVNEVYHPDYVAKRMEIGAVMGAAPRKNVIRENSDPGDIIILLGGRTGRDGCGGATGSSKVHTEESIETCGAEVQKGNPPTERKIQRLFRREEVSRLIKKCNDFGAGGVSVAIGELAVLRNESGAP